MNNIHMSDHAASDEVLAQKHLYIAWVNFQRRPVSMQSFVGYDLDFVPSPVQERWAKPLGYILQAVRTWGVLWRRNPDVVWFQSPPSFIAHVIVLYRVLGLGQFKIVADCHNIALDYEMANNPWPRFPFSTAVLNHCDAILPHNSSVRAKAVDLGIDEEKLHVVETRPSPLQGAHEAPRPGKPLILVPCSFKDDEPIEMLLDVARMLPDFDFRITGNRNRAEKKGFMRNVPANVIFTGFLTPEDYNELLVNATVVLGLTTVEGIQLSVANEAIGAMRPIVLSDTVILRDLFGAAALFAKNEPKPMVEALREASRRQHELIAASKALAITREARWQAQMRTCLRTLARTS